MAPAILSPCAGQPISGHPDRMRGSNDPTKESGPGHGAQSRLGQGHQLLDDVDAVTFPFRQWTGKDLAHVGETLLRSLRTRAERSSKIQRMLCRAIQHRV